MAPRAIRSKLCISAARKLVFVGGAGTNPIAIREYGTAGKALWRWPRTRIQGLVGSRGELGTMLGSGLDSLARIAAVVGAGRSLVGSSFAVARHLEPRRAIKCGVEVVGFKTNFGVGRKTRFN